MKYLKKALVLLLMLVFVGSGVLSYVGNISRVEAASAKISVKKKTLNQGQNVKLTVTGAKGTIKWSVNNDNVKLSKTTGKKVKVTAVKAGNSKVTAKVKGKKLTCTIKVNGLNTVKKELNVGQKFTIKAKGLGNKIMWSKSGNSITIKVAKKKATVTATKVGKSTVIAKVGKKKYKCTVVVTEPAKEPVVTPSPEQPSQPNQPGDLVQPDWPVDSAEALNKVDFVVEVESGRDPVILQLSDTQIIDAAQTREGRTGVDKEYWATDKINERLYDSLAETIEATNPDLILITGDVVYGEFDDNGSALLGFIEKMESFEIPWAPVFGNHDNESAMGVDWQCEQFENAEHCLFKQRTLTGNGNYTVGIKQDGVLKRVFFMMDSNGCGAMHANSRVNGHSTTAVGFGKDQMDWSIGVAEEIKKISPDTKISFAFHIQIYAFKAAYEKYGFTNSNTINNPINIDKLENKAEGDFGYIGRDLKGPWDTNNAFFNRMKAVGVDSIFVGHEHCNSASVVYDGIRFQFSQKIGTYDRANFVSESGAIEGGYCLDKSNPALEPMSGGSVVIMAEDGSIKNGYIYLSGDAQAKLDGTYGKDAIVPEKPVAGLQCYTDFYGDGEITSISTVTIEGENAWKVVSNNQSKLYMNLDNLEGATKFTFSVYVPEESTTTMNVTPEYPLFCIRVKKTETDKYPTFGLCNGGYIRYSTTVDNVEQKLVYGQWQTFTVDLTDMPETCSEFSFNIGEGNVLYLKDIAFE